MRDARPPDAGAIAAIYNQVIAERQATFETRPRPRRRAARAACGARRARGHWKLIGRLFTTNEASIALVRAHGFRDVGVHCRHARLDGRWRDVLVVERLLGEEAAPDS